MHFRLAIYCILRTKWFWNWIFEVRLKMGFRYQGSASVNIDLCFKWSFWFGDWLIWWSWWTDRIADWAPSAVGDKLMWGLFFSNLSLASKPRASFRIFPPCDDKDWALQVLMCSPLCQVVCHIELEKVMRSTSLRELAPPANKLTSWQLAPLFDTEPAWKKRTMYLPRSWENAGMTSFDKNAKQVPMAAKIIKCILSYFLQTLTTFKILFLIFEWHQPRRNSSSLPNAVKTF